MEIRYFDNAATTRVKDEVLEEMLPYLKDRFGNPSSMYTIGREAKKAIEEARVKVAKLINCKAKFRYRQQETDVELEHISDDKILVKYKDGVKSVTPGQACVFYDGEVCLGGGIIKEVRKNNEKLWYL